MRLFQFLSEPSVEVLAASAVLLSSFLVALSTLDDLPQDFYLGISSALFTLDIIFALDFFVRWYAAGQFKAKYLTTPLALIDIVVVVLPLMIGTVMPLADFAMHSSVGEVMDTTYSLATTAASTADHNHETLPFLLHNPIQESAGLQNLLLLRVLRLRRVLTDCTTFSRFIRALGLSRYSSQIKPYQLQLARVLLSIFTLLSVSTGLIYTAEHAVNPLFTDYFTALYFGLTTLTTVGFGDIVPMTPAGRLVVSGSILAGVAIIPAQSVKLVEALLELQKDTTAKEEKRKQMLRQQQRQQQLEGGGKVTYSGLADGKGPSGINLEMPAMDEQTKSMKMNRVLGNGNGGGGSSNAVDTFLPTTTSAERVLNADGKGPSGVNIELPAVDEQSKSMKTNNNNNADTSGVAVETTATVATCSQCGAVSDRPEARFCWSCGNELR
ncbi:MAG: hypothetical protein SGARI_000322 [Bacillariaceae sp.]